MSWRKINLPDHDIVVTWDVVNVVEWLEKSDMKDFVEFVQETNLNGQSLLELDETSIIFNKKLVDISITKRKQLAKCVKECKNQASHAKKQISKCITECKVQANHCKKAVNNTLKSKKERSFGVSQANSNDPEDSESSGNEWGTDFEEDSDDDDESKTSSEVSQIVSQVNEARLTRENRLESTPKQNGSSKFGSYDVQTLNQDQNSNEIALPKDNCSVVLKQVKRYDDVLVEAPNQQPVIARPQVSPQLNMATKPKPPNIAAKPKPPNISPKPKPNIQTEIIPKPPKTNFEELKKLTSSVPLATPISTLTRPKAQPPAPPLKAALPISPFEVPPVPETSPFEDEVEYLTPLHPQPPMIQNDTLVRAYPAFAYQSSNSSTSDSQETYEIISNPDDSGNGSFEFNGNENLELARKQASKIANELRSRNIPNSAPMVPGPGEFRATRNMNIPNSTPPVVPAGPVTIDNSLTPPLPQKLKSPSSISLLQNKIGLKISRNGYASNSNTQQNLKPLPPKTNGFTSYQSNDRLRRPLPDRPVEVTTPKGDSLEEQLYFQNIDREEASRLVLSLGKDGAFLVRPSKKGGVDNPFTLTIVQSGKVFHLNIRKNGGKFALGKEKPNETVFESIPAMISFHRANPIYVTSQHCMGKECFLKVSPPKY